MTSDGKERPSGALAARPALAERVRRAHRARQREADEVHAAAMASRDMVGAGIYDDTVRRYTPGVDPAWLIRAKQLHAELGQCLFVLSRETTIGLSTDDLSAARLRVQAFLGAMPGETGAERVGIMSLLAMVDLVSRRDASLLEFLEVGQTPTEIVCFLLSMVDLNVAERIAEHEEHVATLLARWPDTSARKPTKWVVAADLWERATGKRLSPLTVRQEWSKLRKSRKPADREP